MNSVKLQDVRLIYRSLLLFYIVIMNNQKQRETRKQSHLQLHQKEWNREFPGGTVVRIHLLMQGTQVQSLVQGDPTQQRATMAMHHNLETCTLEAVSHSCWACMPQLLKTRCSRAHTPQQGKPLKWEAHIPQLESRPCTQQLEKTHLQQQRVCSFPQRPSTANK